MKPLRMPFGLITNVRNSGGDNPKSNEVRYDVQVQVGDNQFATFENVVPNNRRPFEDDSEGVIVHAEKGDVVGVYWGGDSPSFMIIEGIKTQECPTNLGVNINGVLSGELPTRELERLTPEQLRAYGVRRVQQGPPTDNLTPEQRIAQMRARAGLAPEVPEP